MNQKNKEKIQSKYAEFQLLSQQVSQLEEQLNNVGEQISELRNLKNNLSELKDLEELNDTMKQKISEANSTLQRLHQELRGLIEQDKEQKGLYFRFSFIN